MSIGAARVRMTGLQLDSEEPAVSCPECPRSVQVFLRAVFTARGCGFLYF